MAEPNGNQTPPAEGAAAGTPPAAGGTPPPAAGTPPPAAAAGTPSAQGTSPAAKKQGAPEFINIPTKEFKKRLRREAENHLKEELGITLEEAKRLLGKASATPPPAAGTPPAPAAGTPTAAAASNPELERLRLENAELTRKSDEEAKKTKKLLRREQDKRTNLLIKTEALLEGVREEEADYVLSLYGRALNALPEGTAPPAPRAFFKSLRATRAHLFTGGAATPPVALHPTTAPPESRQPGGEIPNPAAPGTPPRQKSVEELTDAEFKQRTAATYGYTPGVT